MGSIPIQSVVPIDLGGHHGYDVSTSHDFAQGVLTALTLVASGLDMAGLTVGAKSGMGFSSAQSALHFIRVQQQVHKLLEREALIMVHASSRLSKCTFPHFRWHSHPREQAMTPQPQLVRPSPFLMFHISK